MKKKIVQKGVHERANIDISILRCRYCGELTVEVADLAQCPKGCPGNFSVVSEMKVPVCLHALNKKLNG